MKAYQMLINNKYEASFTACNDNDAITLSYNQLKQNHYDVISLFRVSPPAHLICHITDKDGKMIIS